MKYHISHGPSAVHFVEVAEGSLFKTGQPNDETFVVQDEAARRAFELNYTGFREFYLQEEYDDGEYVTFKDNLYRATATVEPYVESDFEEEVKPFIPTPVNNTKDWTLITIPDEEQGNGRPV
mgnify:CR=1 FL=1